ncbi:hypothetical protein EK21DRAFT_99897 [Setomelanomma holmii]|uniref:RING-type domain-containing protein n=1 Tax=Setomelanomma holmii TaxID=210430 RepID=A0A9P4HBP6_9PLEO|nr:hypothetical protein EK21DRAFT_99897 [Setomelanomma holmii]
MPSKPVLYEDFVDHVLAALPSTAAPGEPSCPICNAVYGQAGPGLPGVGRRTFIQDVVEAVKTPCGHNFCTFCIAAWLKARQPTNCPMCRGDIVLPQPLRDWDEEGHWTSDDTAVDGLAISLHVPYTRSVAIHQILTYSTRQQLLTNVNMGFMWNPTAMIFDLTRLMVTIARRFHYQANREVVPQDLSYMRLHNPVDRMTDLERADTRDLEYFARPDAPLTKHPDAINMYKLLCSYITRLSRNFGATRGKCYGWQDPAYWFYKHIKREMRHANGGIGKNKWRYYVRCVSKAVVIWQCYCEHVLQIKAGKFDLTVDDRRAGEGVIAVRVD